MTTKPHEPPSLVTQADAAATRMPMQAPPIGDPVLSIVERVMRDKDADMDKLERLLALHERNQQREERRAFDQALAAAKSEIEPVVRSGRVRYMNSKGQLTDFKHETLDGIAKAVDPVLSKYGLSYRFRSEQKDGLLHVTCIVAHRDGHSEDTSLSGSPDTSGSKNSYQAVGSAATYLQRYTLKLALGLSAAHDDDAQGAGGEADPPATISPDQFIELRDKIEEVGFGEDTLIKAYGGTPGKTLLEEFPADKFAEVMTRLKAYGERRAEAARKAAEQSAGA